MSGGTILHYRIARKLGEGGMGVVYKARDTRLDRDVVLKLLRPDVKATAEREHRFLREARSASALNHPGIVTIYDIHHTGSDYVIVMEYVEGTTLSECVGPGGLPVERAVNYAMQIADSLAAAHEAGIIHRDLKPGNIMVTPKGKVKLLDFGLAKRVSAPGGPEGATASLSTLLTRTGTVMGTLAYMSPEQAAGDEIDIRSDIFSFGVVLYEMLAGRRPFQGDSAVALLREVYSASPPPVASFRTGTPEALDRILVKALAKDREERYQSMAEFARDLDAVARNLAAGAGPVSVTRSAIEPIRREGPASAPPTSERRRKDSRRRIAAAGVAALFLAAALGYYVTTKSWAPKPGKPFAVTESASPLELYRRGREALASPFRKGSVDMAIELLRAALAKDPESAPAEAALADAYTDKFTYSPDDQWLRLAREAAAGAVKSDDHLAAAHAAHGSALMLEGELDGADAAFRRALDLDPRSVPALVRLAQLRSRQERPIEALSALNTAAGIDGNSWLVHQELGILHYTQGDYDLAAASLERSRDLAPDNPRVYRLLAAAYHMQDRFEDAAGALQKALEIEPSASVYANLGTLQFFRGRYQDAVAAFEKAVELDANYYLLWGNLGDGYRMLPGRESSSLDSYTRAIQLVRERLEKNPNDLAAHSSLAVYLARRGDTVESRREVRNLGRRRPDTPAVLFKMALASEAAGDRVDALAYLEDALSKGYSLKEVRGEPDLVELRADSRYHRLMLKFGDQPD